MSNAVDVLFIGGNHDGLKVCQPRPVPIILNHNGAEYVSASVMVDEFLYWVAIASGTTPTSAEVEAAIILHNHKPSWDLNRDLT